MRPTFLAVLAAVACGGPLHAQACSPGRVVKDPTGPYGGSNDLNGDGAFDISDMVYGLGFLFLGRPAPCPLIMLDQPVQPAGFPATGQTRCYLACDQVDFPGQDGFYQAGCPRESRFKDNGDGTVTDNCTGLMWQQWGGANGYDWLGSLKYCDGLELAGYSDWRLPNIREMESLVDYMRVQPDRDPVFEGLHGAYWSSSITIIINPRNEVWIVDFTTSSGSISSVGIIGTKSYSRAVRGP